MASEQSYKSHRRFFPIHHFIVMPILIANIFVEGRRLYRFQTPYHVWLVIVAIALLLFTLTARTMALTAQNRVIRLEERLRLASLLPDAQRAQIGNLTPSQLVGLRFAPDDEVPELVRRCLAGELKGAEAVKKAVTNWRADHLRV